MYFLLKIWIFRFLEWNFKVAKLSLMFALFSSQLHWNRHCSRSCWWRSGLSSSERWDAPAKQWSQENLQARLEEQNNSRWLMITKSVPYLGNKYPHFPNHHHQSFTFWCLRIPLFQCLGTTYSIVTWKHASSPCPSYMTPSCQKTSLMFFQVGGWFTNPFEKICSSNGIISTILRGEHKEKYVKPPTSFLSILWPPLLPPNHARLAALPIHAAQASASMIARHLGSEIPFPTTLDV